MSKTDLFQAIQLSISTQFQCQKLFYFNKFSSAWVFSSNVKSVLYQTIQFNMSTHSNSIWPIDRTLSGVTIPGQSGPRSDGNNGVLCILQSSGITEVSPSDCLVSYLGHSLEESCLSVDMQSVYSAASANRARLFWSKYIKTSTNRFYYQWFWLVPFIDPSNFFKGNSYWSSLLRQRKKGSLKDETCQNYCWL